MYLKVADPRFVDPAALTEVAQTAAAVGYDPVPLLAHLAAKTERIRIGSSAINIPYRHPAVLANELATIDKLSGGRLCVGLVAGYLPEEYETLGLDARTRGDLADECVAA